ncbi:MAG: glutathione S-transferase [Alphaproteobacteria bacterium]|nr:glutathione S-transferase [Alphaproteobacteria bacterium]
MLTVHHLGVSQSERIVWLCEELGIDYKLERYDRDPVTRLAPAALKALHPMGTAPVITDGDLVMAESGAIIEYIIATYGKGRFKVAPDHPDFAQFIYWFHFGNGSLQAILHRYLNIRRLEPRPDHPTLLGVERQLASALGMMDKRLGAVDYLAGAFSAADIITVFCLTTMRSFAPYDLGKYPNILAYLKRIGARPAYQRAMQKGDPGMTPKLG